MRDSDKLLSHRFTPINENLISTLVNSQLYFSSIQNLNDPYDCKIDIEGSLKNAMKAANDEQKIILRVYTREILSQLKEKIEQVGVVCFSKQLNNKLMWSHYAKNHTGLCLTYEIPSEFILNNSPPLLGWDEVRYGNEEIKNFFLKLNSSNGANESKHFIEPLVIALMTTKSIDWGCEQEFRIVKSEPGKLEIDRSWLKQICFGLATTNEHISLIKKIISNHGYSNIVFAKMTRSSSCDFGFEAQAI